jgi:hypothetical protein
MSDAPVFGRRVEAQVATPRPDPSIVAPPGGPPCGPSGGPTVSSPVASPVASPVSSPVSSPGASLGAPAPRIVAQPPQGAGIGVSTELRTLCLSRLDPGTVAGMSPERLGVEVERLVSEIATEHRIQLNAREQRRLSQDLVDDMLGLGPLEPLLEDEAVADIMVNGPDRVFVERRGKVTLTTVRFRDRQHLANISQRIAAKIGRRIDESSPMVDARLDDGSRVNIVFPPLALDGPYLSIRKFSRRQIDIAKLVSFGSMSAQLGRVLELMGRARLNIIISGGTGSGKTTLLNAISRMIDPGERVVTIEDAAELQLQQPPCGATGDAAPQHRGPRRDHPARPDPQRTAHAARPHHRGVRHAAGDKHRPRRQHVNGTLEQYARRADPDREYGADEQHGPALARHKNPGAECGGRDRAGRPPA